MKKKLQKIGIFDGLHDISLRILEGGVFSIFFKKEEVLRSSQFKHFKYIIFYADITSETDTVQKNKIFIIHLLYNNQNFMQHYTPTQIIKPTDKIQIAFQ